MRERVEEYLPRTGSLPREQIELVRTRYAFQQFPQLLVGMPLPPTFVFTHGKFQDERDSFAIFQLSMKADGDIVLATTTEQAERVLDDLVQLLDTHLGFRLSTAQKTKSFVSNVVVEFDKGLENDISALSRIADAINRLRIGMPALNIKRLAFGLSSGGGEPTDPLLAVEQADFLIERRADMPYEANRYFCSAPLSTTDHIRLLEGLEAVIRGEAA
jgi:hypothetical protein